MMSEVNKCVVTVDKRLQLNFHSTYFGETLQAGFLKNRHGFQVATLQGFFSVCFRFSLVFWVERPIEAKLLSY